jgi:uncharacterized membrane protein YfcA
MAAGAINVVVGSGTLVTFPVLLAVGYSPLVANVSNTVGLVPGSVAGAVGYRRELAAHRGLVLRLAVASVTGGLVGAALLLTLSPGAFEVIVPVLVGLAVVLVAGQPWLARRLGTRASRGRAHVGPFLLGAVFATGVYGGYFGAAQGVILLGVMGLALPLGLQEINGIKNVLAGLVNGVAALVFLLSADVAWQAVGLIAVGSAVGGALGAKVARRLPEPVLRAAVVVVGVVALVLLLR